MAYGIVLTFDSVTEDQYWGVNKRLGINADGTGDYPDGLLCHVGGPTVGGGWLVSEVWTSKADQEQFMATKLGAALAAEALPHPRIVESEELANVMIA